MGLKYQAVQWNLAKKRYDLYIGLGIILYLGLFIVASFILDEEKTAETVLIRALGSLALVMLHIILVIGPLARLNTSFLPLLYNRRHFGVLMFFMALFHGGFALFQFHGLAEINPIWALFTSNSDYDSLLQFPFQVLGFFALIILAIMASTSHDFFLANLGARVWKSLHMLVYVAYGLILMHVVLGSLQQERSSFLLILMTLGFLVVASLHLWSGINEYRRDSVKTGEKDTWLKVGSPSQIENNTAVSVNIGGERVAIFRKDDEFYAVHSVCKHQGGPLDEGRIVDGCITCPWHGYQYLPHNGQSPPPFTEKIATYNLQEIDGDLYINPEANTEGAPVSPLKISKS